MPDEKPTQPADLMQTELLRCNRCGYCLSACPTYQVTRCEAQVARGRNVLLDGLLRDELPDLEELRGPFFDCLLCGACEEACPSSVRTGEVMVRARQRFHAGHGQPWVQRFIFRRLLARPERLTALLRLLGTGQRTGLTRLARRLGILRWINATLHSAEGLVETMPRSFLRDRLRAIGFRPLPDGQQWVLPRDPAALAPGPRVACFLGCGTNYQVPRSGEAALRLLARAGCEVVAWPHLCCGLPAYAYGDLDSARELARRNLDLFTATGAEYLVSDCGSCSAMLKDYAELFAGERADRDRAVAFSARVRDFTELLAELPLPPPVRPFPGTVTYHDPCHLGRGQGLREAPRRLLTEAAGARLIELPEADRCCGGAGSYNLTHPELSLAVLDRKLDCVASTGADTLATACPACLLQLGYGLRRRGSPLALRHVAEIVAEAQGLPLGE